MKIPKIKYIRQHNSSDCGVACLDMVFKYYGSNISYSRIIKYAETNSAGTSMKGMANAAVHFNFEVNALKAGNKEDILQIDKLPFIAHMYNRQLNHHYVVVYRISFEGVLVADPVKGIVSHSIDEFFQDWTGKFLLLQKKNTMIQDNKSESTLKRLLSIVVSKKRMISKIIIFSMAGVILSVISSGYLAFLIDYILPNKQTNFLHFISIAVLSLYIIREIVEVLRKRLTNFFAQKICIELMLNFFNHLMKLPMRFFQKYSSGEIISRFNDAEQVCNTIAIVSIYVLMDLLMIILAVSIMIFISYKMVLVSIIPISLYVLLIKLFKNKIEETNRKTMVLKAGLTSFLNESLHGIDFIKIYNSEKKIKNEIKLRFMLSSNNAIHKGKIISLHDSSENLIYAIFITVIIWFGTNEILKNRLTVGELVAIYTLLGYFLSPIQRIANLQESVQSTLLAANRLFEIMDVVPEDGSTEDKGSEDMKYNFKGNIVFDHISFGYSTQGNIIRDFDLEIQHGMRTAIIGKSGAGKTTIIRLLLKLYHSDFGHICINGNDIEKISIRELRNNIAYVPQDVFFFSGSIKDNFTLFHEDITQEEIEEACKKIKIHEYILSLPCKYETLLIENANNLSGGQRQLLSIARALVKHPDILILDEVTSNLDSISVDVIKELIYKSLKNITIIIISHDMRFIKSCEKILVLSEGKIVGSGTHDELVKYNSHYYELLNDFEGK